MDLMLAGCTVELVTASGRVGWGEESGGRRREREGEEKRGRENCGIKGWR